MHLVALTSIPMKVGWTRPALELPPHNNPARQRQMTNPSLVYNHVLRLNLNAKQWNLVDNYGDIPGVRMGMSTPPCLLYHT